MNSLKKVLTKSLCVAMGLGIAVTVFTLFESIALASHGGSPDDTKSGLWLRDVGGSWIGDSNSRAGTYNEGSLTMDWDHVLDFRWDGERNCYPVNFAIGSRNPNNDTMYNRGNSHLAPGQTRTFGHVCRHRTTSRTNVRATKRSVPVTAQLRVRSTNDPTWRNISSVTIDHDEVLDFSWSSSNATSCTGTNFVTGGSTSGSDTGVNPPGLGANRTYRVSCTGSGVTASDQVVVTRLHPAAETELKIRTTNNPVWQPAVGTIDIDHDETVDLTWSSTNATACAGTNVNTAGQVAGTETDVALPTPGSSRTYTVTCSGPGADMSRQVVVNRLSIPPTNLGVSGFTVITSAGFDRTTGAYDSVSITGSVDNSGADTTVSAEYEVELPTLTVIDTGTIPMLALGATHSAVGTFSNIAFGALDVVLRADTTNVIAESDETDNVLAGTVTIPPPAPSMTLTTPQPVISDSTAPINWDTDVSYPMNCVVQGPGMSAVSFDPSVSGSTGSSLATGITSGGLFELRCTEPISGSEFIEQLTIEVVGNVQEI